MSCLRFAVRTLSGGLPVGLLLVSLSMPLSAGEGPEGGVPAGTLAAVDGVLISEENVERHAGAQLAKLRSQEFQLKEQALQDLIAQELLKKGAAARKLSVEEFVRVEIEAKVAAVTEAEIQANYQKFKARLQGRSEEEGLKLVENYLRSQRMQSQRESVVRKLRNEYKVKVYLEPQRVDVAVDDDPSLGPDDAPVTIVEFSDFQCPYCARVKPTLDRLTERYGSLIKVVFRDFPLPMHKEAPKAAEAGHCAHEQGKFWKMHDRMFEDQKALGLEGLKKSAEAIGLDMTAFNECLSSGRYSKEWTKDVADGQRYGVTGTPAFFINGRPMSGAVPFEKLAEVIEDELQRKGIAVPPPAAKKSDSSS